VRLHVGGGGVGRRRRAVGTCGHAVCWQERVLGDERVAGAGFCGGFDSGGVQVRVVLCRVYV
jgi:hypothetical protein